MGFESYNLKIEFLESINVSLVRDFLQSIGYTIIDRNVLEKSLEIGFIEVLLNDNNISMRTAKANSEQVVIKMLEDIKTLNNVFQISVIDLQMKHEVAPENYSETLENFIDLRNEFYEQFPETKYPIRCNDVFSTT